MKTRKAVTKRVKITKRGKILVRQPGQNHFRAKRSRQQKLKGKALVGLAVSQKSLGRYLSFNQ